jgi:hypothetical protein
MAGAIAGIGKLKGFTMKSGLVSRLALLSSIFLFCDVAGAQTMARYTLDTWQDNDIAETMDHPIVAMGGHVNNDSQGTQMFHWDSYGRVRINRDDADAPFFGYRVLFIDAATHSPLIRSTMDEFDLAVGLHLGQIGDWDLSTMLGAGYSSTHPFENSDGYFGIGHLLAEYHYDDNNSFLLSGDYEGNGGLFPDVPLPGFAFIHHEDKLDYMVGYPMSSIKWRPMDKVEITAQYNVPYTAELDVEYRLAKHFGLYSDSGNFFQGFATRNGTLDNRQFFQMRRTEMGVRFIYDPWVDASLGLGYSFDQGYSSGFDVRDMRPLTHISNEPYLGFMIRGRF